MELTAAKEMAKEKVLHRLYLSNIKNQERIKGNGFQSIFNSIY